MSSVLIRIGTCGQKYARIYVVCSVCRDFKKKELWKGPILVRSRVASSDRWVGFSVGEAGGELLGAVVGPLWAWRRRSKSGEKFGDLLEERKRKRAK